MTVLSSDPEDSEDQLSATFGSPGGRLLDQEPWRSNLTAELFRDLTAWVSLKHYDIRHRSWITRGGSGAIIAHVHLRRPGRNLRGAVLKLVRPGLVAEEARNIAAAQNSPPAFCREHILPLTTNDILPATGWGLHLMDVAERDGRPLQPLSELADRPDFGRRCAEILRCTVRDWNNEIGDPDPIETTANEFLTRFVTAYGTPLDGLKDFASEHGFDWNKPTLEFRSKYRDESLANPFALLAGGSLRATVLVFRGNGHGDLHMDNILVDPDDLASFDRFKLIDLGRFSRTAAISRDPVKMLLSSCEQWARVNPEPWKVAAVRLHLAEITVGRQPATDLYTQALDSHLATVTGLDQAAGTWAAERCSSAEWRIQHDLTLAGAALRRAGDTSLSPEWREWYFDVAALATTRFVSHARVERTEPTTVRDSRQPKPPKETEGPAEPGPDPPPIRRSTTPLWSVAALAALAVLAFAYFHSRPDLPATEQGMTPSLPVSTNTTPPSSPTPLQAPPGVSASPETSDIPLVLFDQKGRVLRVSSSPKTSDEDKIDLDTACPGWGSMGGVWPKRCGDSADLIADQEGLHTSGDQQGLLIMSTDDAFAECVSAPASRLTQQLDVIHLVEGLELCVHTDKSRIAQVIVAGFHLDEKGELQNIEIDFVVWDH